MRIFLRQPLSLGAAAAGVYPRLRGVFSHFNGRSVYPYPIGDGDRRAVIEEILLDAKQRGIPCRIVSMTAADQAELQGGFPTNFSTAPTGTAMTTFIPWTIWPT